MSKERIGTDWRSIGFGKGCKSLCSFKTDGMSKRIQQQEEGLLQCVTGKDAWAQTSVH